MANVIVAFPKAEDARSIRSLLVRNGYQVSYICVNGLQVLQAADTLGSGVVVCGYKFTDMIYEELRENLPRQFEMLLLASRGVLEEGVCDNVTVLTMPLKVNELLGNLENLVRCCESARKRRRQLPPKRTEEEKQQIEEAKLLLMKKHHMTEEKAHRYLQKISMDSGNSIVETAQMIFALENEETK